MKCPHCGTENENNAIFCRQCNGWILGKRYEDPAEPADAPQTENHIKCPNCGAKNALNAIFCRQCDAWILSDKFEEPTPPPAPEPPAPPKEEKPERKPRRLWLKFGVPAAAVLAAVAMLLVIFLPKDPEIPANDRTVKYVRHIQPYAQGGQLHIISDDVLLEFPYSVSGFDSYQNSLDGTAAAILGKSGSLYYVQENNVSHIDSIVTDYILSASGEGILFVAAGKLGYYHSSVDAPTLIPTKNAMTIVDLAISPDGKTVAYILHNSSNYSRYLMCYYLDAHDSVNLGAVTSTTDLLSISNGGEYIYVADSVNVRCYNANGVSTYVGIHDDQYNAQDAAFVLNADHTQLLFYYGGHTYLADKDQKAVDLGDAVLTPIKPANCSQKVQGAVMYAAYRDLRDICCYVIHYTATDNILGMLIAQRELWYVDADAKAQQIATRVSKFWVDESGHQLFYVSGEKSALERYDPQTGQHTAIAEYVKSFTLTPDGKTLYYCIIDAIYRCNAADGSDAVLLSKDTTYQLMLMEGNRLYYTLEQNLYTFDEAGIRQLAQKNAWLAQVSDNGILYLRTNDSYYACGADGTAKKLFSLSNEPVYRPYPNATYG